MVVYVIAIVLVAFVFDFINGFHDSANSIATIVGTRVLSPFKAVLWASLFNFLAAFTTGTAVAKAVGSGFIDIKLLDANLIFAALLGAIAWNLITWFFGIPSSSSHALIGAMAGAGLAKGGSAAITWGTKWNQTLLAIILSPTLGAIVGLLLMILVMWIFYRVSANRAERFFKVAQLGSSGFLSLAHGSNDAQKTMGVIMALLVGTQQYFANETGLLRFMYIQNFDHIPKWIELSAYTAIALGTLFGGWRIVHTMGSRITRLRPVGGFCAETAGALVIYTASQYGIPVSTTHTIAGSIVGVGATHRLSAVRWGIAGRIVWAWILTIPASAIMA
ncbi:MAG TPA: inorganic phosphate transporter, partial [Gemmatimonadaceae bacterium]